MAKQTYVGSIKHRLNLRWFRRGSIGLVILLLVVAVVTAYVVLANKSQQEKAKKEQFRKALQDSSKLQKESKPKAALEAITNYLATNPTDNQQKAVAEFEAARLSATSKDYKKAVEWGEKAIANTEKPTYVMYILQADNYKVLGDKQNALKYYKLAIESLGNPSDPYLKGRLEYAKNNVGILENGKQPL